MFVWLKFVSSFANSTKQTFMHSGDTSDSSWGFYLYGSSGYLRTRWTTYTKLWANVSARITSYNVWTHVGITWGPTFGLKLYVVSVLAHYQKCSAPNQPRPKLKTLGLL